MRTLRWRSCRAKPPRSKSIWTETVAHASQITWQRVTWNGWPVPKIGTEGFMPSKSEKEIILAPGGNGAAPEEAEELLPALDDMTPREIVAELDKYIVGQNAAKRAVAVALRNRVRRQKLPPEIAEDVLPKNILMIGPTGVGKTEIARRLARLAGCPFVKVEASKYTEVGYVGRDVESMVRDLVEMSIRMVREAKFDEVADSAQRSAEERVITYL